MSSVRVCVAIAGLLLFGSATHAVAQFQWLPMVPTPWSSGSFAAYNPALCYDSQRAVVVMVATEQVPVFRSRTWEWDGTAWHGGTPGTDLPIPRVGAQVAYDEVRGQTVLFGGIAGGASRNDTWLWNGTSWRAASPSTSPPPAANHGMCFHAASGRVVMASGVLQGSAAFETWTWDGTTWTREAPSTVPPIGEVHAMCYDRARGRAVIVHAHRGTSTLATWEWNGSDWLHRDSNHVPPMRIHHALAYDTVCQRTLLFGGGLPPAPPIFDDTWQWDGTDWQALQLSPRPTPRHVHGMAYDAARRSLVMVGGSNSGRPVDDGWLFSAPASSRPYGRGCPVLPLPPLSLTASPPQLGQTLTLDLANVPTFVLGAVYLDPVSADVGLPFSPGCRLYINQLGFLVGVGLGSATNHVIVQVPLPFQKDFIGAPLFGQGFAVVGVPALTLYSSNGTALTVGL